MSARTRILDRLKTGRFVPDAKPENFNAKALISQVKNNQQLIDQFEAGLSVANAEVRYCKQGDEVNSLLTWIQPLNNVRCWISEDSKLGQQLWQQKPDGAKWFNPKEPMESQRHQVFNEIDLSITETVGAIAETGTLVVIPDNKEPRTMSLVPPIHIAVVKLDTLVPRFEDWVVQNPGCSTNTNVLFITGPSKTADIQQTLAYGAHGPKRLFVLLVE